MSGREEEIRKKGEEGRMRGGGGEDEWRRWGLPGQLTSLSCTLSSLTATNSRLISYFPLLFFQAARGLARASRVVEKFIKICVFLLDQ